ncbi:DUF1330 domain-containing protein [Amycolatopsis sp. NPDC059027]|uniref:DUF1330 domain-containing protein n=1 Tax=unclassified Amycolatopsis TaxID=2618356 RepID=UPI00366DEC59
MSAYVISESEVLDEAVARRYRELAAASIAQYGGTYLARGVKPEAAEGEFSAARRVVVLEFPDMARVWEWYESPEYIEARKLSETALDRRILFVDGVVATQPQAG